jgi:transcription elongation factor GreA
MNKVPMTVQGERALREELERLKREERPRITQAIAEAREHGDLKENAEYHAAREQQSFVEGRIMDIEGKLSHAQVIDVSTLPQTGKVIFGVTVKLLNVETDDSVTYRIVGDDEADAKKNLIFSPGRAAGWISSGPAPGCAAESVRCCRSAVPARRRVERAVPPDRVAQLAIADRQADLDQFVIAERAFQLRRHALAEAGAGDGDHGCSLWPMARSWRVSGWAGHARLRLGNGGARSLHQRRAGNGFRAGGRRHRGQQRYGARWSRNDPAARPGCANITTTPTCSGRAVTAIAPAPATSCSNCRSGTG